MKFHDFVIWTCVMAIIGIVFNVILTLPQTKYGSEVEFTVGKNDHIEITGAELVNITITSPTYFVVASGDTLILDQISDSDGNFSATGTLSTSNLQILDGSSANVHITPVGTGHVLKVYKEYSASTNNFSAFIVWILAFVIWIMVIVMLS